MRHHHRLIWASCDEASNRADSAHTSIRKTRVSMVSSSVAGTLIGAHENTLSLSLTTFGVSCFCCSFPRCFAHDVLFLCCEFTANPGSRDSVSASL